MPDGSRQFALYVAGTQAPAGFGGDDPFDELSNVQLYAGVSSASYQATLEALRQAGAQPGDVLHDFGHSQGAMITAHVALEAGYDARTHVTFGSPVEADVGGGTLSVAVAHTDDPVAALQGGGHREAVGGARELRRPARGGSSRRSPRPGAARARHGRLRADRRACSTARATPAWTASARSSTSSAPRRAWR